MLDIFILFSLNSKIRSIIAKVKKNSTSENGVSFHTETLYSGYNLKNIKKNVMKNAIMGFSPFLSSQYIKYVSIDIIAIY